MPATDLRAEPERTVITSVHPPLPLTAWHHYVLIVEEDVELRQSYCSAIRASRVAAIGVADGPEALRLVASEPPAVVILDFAMRRLDGHRILQALKASPDTRDIPVVVVAGADKGDVNPDQIACLLQSPVDASTLVAAVQHAFRQSSVARPSSSRS
jgi:CheY-like chemotaxis protein